MNEEYQASPPATKVGIRQASNDNYFGMNKRSQLILFSMGKGLYLALQTVQIVLK